MKPRPEVPLFCEVLTLRGWARWSLLLSTGASTIAGIGVGAWGSPSLGWLSGLCLTLATAGFFGLFRLSHFETSVGRFGVKAGCWQLFWSFPRGAVGEVLVRRARSWRSLFSTQEATFRIQDPEGPRLVTIPVRDAQGLVTSLQENP